VILRLIARCLPSALGESSIRVTYFGLTPINEQVEVKMPRTDFLNAQRRQITKRLDELRPLYEEYLTLEKAQEALGQLGGPVRRAVGRGRPAAMTRRGPGRPRTRRSPGRPRRRATAARRRTTAARGRTTRATTRTRRSRAGGTRADQAFDAIKKSPGISIPELATKLRIRPNYLYRVTAGLEREGRVKRRDGGFHPA
jgi:hypothetical protein